MIKYLWLTLLLTYCAIQSFGQGLDAKSLNKVQYLFSETNKPVKPTLNPFMVDSLSFTKDQSILLFGTMPNRYQHKQTLPLFCEIEHQLSKLIKRRVKLGVP